ncbi:PH domain-containing protein [Nocardiopsis sp. RSe5-2]|uniref:PH domain-containing protein n=1 Tax=Nocardiopsis endophytica TaxID=3018445 RepID=A0ABT4UBD9_9ACTN|nr:PH domain-containing protein [Nocardiopsis endophytica]MDA2813642.1 PH domain-containing protein [Nocardiopsis endophytica]
MDGNANTGAPQGLAAPGAPVQGWTLLSPLTVWADAVIVGLVVPVPALVAAVVMAVAGAPAVWPMLTLLGAAVLVVTIIGADVMRYRRTRYRLTATRFEAVSGVIARSHKSLPRERIRSVDVAVPLWARAFGLCRVEVGTGESTGAGGTLALALVPVAEGERLRRLLLAHGAAAGAGADGSAELARMAPRWFGYGALAWTSAGIGYGGLAAVLGSLTELILRLVLPWVLGYAESAPVSAIVLWAAGVVAAFVAVATAVALAVQVESWWGFRLTREPDSTLRVQRGLLTRTSVSIEERRMRGVELLERLPLRWLGAASVAAVASGLDQAQDGQGGNKGGIVPKRALTPEMPRAQARRAAEEAVRAQGGIAFEALRRHPLSALRRRIMRALAAAVVLAAVVGAASWALGAFTSLEVPAEVAALDAAGTGGAVLLLGVPYAVGCYRGLGHGIDGRFLLLRKGMAARSTVALKRDSVIGWTVRRSPFQRWSGLATLGATVAAGSGIHRAPDVDLGEGLAFADEAVPGLLAPFLEKG